MVVVVVEADCSVKLEPQAEQLYKNLTLNETTNELTVIVIFISFHQFSLIKMASQNS